MVSRHGRRDDDHGILFPRLSSSNQSIEAGWTCCSSVTGECRSADDPRMQVCLLKSKIHRATITDGNLKYEGSLTIATDLMEKCGLIPYERILCSTWQTEIASRPTPSPAIRVRAGSSSTARLPSREKEVTS